MEEALSFIKRIQRLGPYQSSQPHYRFTDGEPGSESGSWLVTEPGPKLRSNYLSPGLYFRPFSFKEGSRTPK